MSSTSRPFRTRKRRKHPPRTTPAPTDLAVSRGEHLHPWLQVLRVGRMLGDLLEARVAPAAQRALVPLVRVDRHTRQPEELMPNKRANVKNEKQVRGAEGQGSRSSVHGSGVVERRLADVRRRFEPVALADPFECCLERLVARDLDGHPPVSPDVARATHPR